MFCSCWKIVQSYIFVFGLRKFAKILADLRLKVYIHILWVNIHKIFAYIHILIVYIQVLIVYIHIFFVYTLIIDTCTISGSYDRG